ncbi:MAG: hypothetical protein U0441_12655 [Polyangiaceae bacterium]
MNRISFGGLVVSLAVSGLSCTPKDEKFGPPQSADTTSLPTGGQDTGGAGGSHCGGTGGMGGVGGTGGSNCGATGGTGGGTGGSTCSYDGGTGGDVTPATCNEPGVLVSPGEYGQDLSTCDFRAEAYHYLAEIANDGKLIHDNVGTSCASAITVPANGPPPGTYYRPQTGGFDFDTGDSSTGWACLGFSSPIIVHCQYAYKKGATPVTDQQCGVSSQVNPETFEVAAMCDQDGDGKLAYFTLVGEYDPANGGAILNHAIREFYWNQ